MSPGVTLHTWDGSSLHGIPTNWRPARSPTCTGTSEQAAEATIRAAFRGREDDIDPKGVHDPGLVPAA